MCIYYQIFFYICINIVSIFYTFFNKRIIVVDSDVDESTKDTITSSDRFTKYVDCQETLVELSFIKWMSGFRLECRRLASNFNKDLYFGLLNFVHV